jgi:hypothetical protein
MENQTDAQDAPPEPVMTEISAEQGPSPYWPGHLVDLFFRPRKFFSDGLALGKVPYYVAAAWLYGVAAAIDRVDQELLRAELGHARKGWELIGPFVAGSWGGFWVWVLAAGAVGAVFWWLLGGWWFRLRIGWSGAKNPNRRLSRLVYVYSGIVSAAPQILESILDTALYENDAEAFAAEGAVSDVMTLVGVLLMFWSLATAYVGVRTVFQVSREKALFWFVVLPGSLYLVVGGIAMTLVALLSE